MRNCYQFIPCGFLIASNDIKYAPELRSKIALTCVIICEIAIIHYTLHVINFVIIVITNSVNVFTRNVIRMLIQPELTKIGIQS